jgi:hypothetical protein
MNNFICVNVASFDTNYLDSAYEHNVDREKNGEEIDYLLDGNDSLGNDSETYLHLNSVVSCGTYAENLRNYLVQKTETSKQSIKVNFDYLEQERKKQLVEENRNDYQQKHLVELVISISEEKAKEYLNSGVDIKEGFRQYVKNLEKDFGLKSLNLSFHFDEGYIDKDNIVHHNIHAHLIGFNHSFFTKKSILSNFEKKDFRKLQTLAQNSFREVGLDFKRGVSKLKSKKNHLDRNDYILQKQAKELKQMALQLAQRNKEIKDIYSTINKQKQLLLELRKQFENDSNIYKMLSVNINILKSEDKKYRDEYRILDAKLKDLKSEIGTKEIEIVDIEQYKQEIKEDIKQYLLKNTTKNNGKYTINNMQQFYKDLVNSVQSASNLDLKIDEIEKQRIKNQDLVKRLESAKSENNILNSKLEKIVQLDKKIVELIELKNHLEDENYNLKSFLSDKNLESKYEEYLKNERETKSNNHNFIR